MSPFTSIPDMAQQMFPIFPARWIVRTQFDNATKLARYQGVLLIGHSTADVVVPYEQGERLNALATQTRWKKFVTYQDWGHGVPPTGFYQEVKPMLEQTPNEVIQGMP
jgi:hypothetical protein